MHLILFRVWFLIRGYEIRGKKRHQKCTEANPSKEKWWEGFKRRKKEKFAFYIILWRGDSIL
jgi:hypothetical protein